MSAPTVDYKALLKQALVAVDEMKARLSARAADAAPEPIAIVGMGCRFPGGAVDPGTLWRLLRDGVDAVTDVPADRWDADAYYDSNPATPGRMIARCGGFLDRVDVFDAAFFGISPREAATMDPQQRLLLEVAWEALEHAGQAPDGLVGSNTGVFVGITTSDYAHLVGAGRGEQSDVYAATGSALNAAAGRLAFTLGLQGPCMAIDTACSSSLVAVHLACQSLRTRESELAIAGGVNVVLRPDAAVLFSKWGMLAPDGRCKTFDRAADGFVRSEGCGLVVLKRLADAVADGDAVLAVIRGSAVNSDGRSSGLTVPNGPAQQAVIRRALTQAGVEPGAIDYVEAHGTGTPLGDPIEVEALAAELGRDREASHPLRIGSIKTNIGHAEAASGIAGLMKTVLALGHEAIPPHLHFREPNERIAWERCAIEVPVRLTPWPRGDRRRLAGVSSFGFSGTNAHVVLEEAPGAAVDVADARPREILVLSARTRDALTMLASRYARHIESHPALPLAGMCAMAATGRADLPHRFAVHGASAGGIIAALDAFAESGGHSATEVSRGASLRTAFLFTGQGAQYVGMGRQLYETHETFRREFDRCAALLDPFLDRPLAAVVLGSDADRESLDQTGRAQPALFAVEYAMAAVWRDWGIEPALVLGHSAGEIAAAAVSGAIGLEDAARIVSIRGRLMQALPAGGAMAAVSADEATVASMLRAHGGGVEIAAVNAPAEVVISGGDREVGEICQSFDAKGIRTRRLAVSHAFHSARMEPMLDDFVREIGTVRTGSMRVPLVSNVTGRLVTDAHALDARYWAAHVRQPVRFADAVRAASAEGISTFLEVGPAPILSRAVAQILGDPAQAFAAMRRGQDEWATLLGALGGLYMAGASVAWKRAFARAGVRKAPLPTYPFQRERHWIDTRPQRSDDNDSSTTSGLLRSSVSGELIVQTSVSAPGTAFLDEHRAFGMPIYPAAGYLSLAIGVLERLDVEAVKELADVSLHAPMIVPDGVTRLVQTVLTPAGGGGYRFTISSAPAGDDVAGVEWTRHASGSARLLPPIALDETNVPGAADLVAPRVVEPGALYRRMEAAGLRYGAHYRRLDRIEAGADEAVASIPVTSPIVSQRGDGPHPALLDMTFQVLGAAWLCGDTPVPDDTLSLPLGFRRVAVASGFASAGRLSCRARVRSAAVDGMNVMTGDISCRDQGGTLVAVIEGFTARRAPREVLLRALGGGVGGWLHDLAWRPVPDRAVEAMPPGHALVLADASAVGDALAVVLRTAGWDVTIAPRESEPGSRTIVEQLAAAQTRVGRPVSQVVCLGSLDETSESREAGARDLGLGRVVDLCRDLASDPATREIRLVITTRGAFAAGGVTWPVSPVQAATWGAARVIMSEQPQLGLQLIDVDPAASPAEAAGAIAAEIGRALDEPQIAYRSGERLIARLVPSRPAQGELPVPSGAYALTTDRPGVLDRLALTPASIPSPARDEVQIRVRVSALNFRDVLNALGMYPGDAGPLGSESVGDVIAVGDDVRGLAVGDRVMAIAGQAFTSVVCAKAALVQKIPSGLTDEAAATVPTAYLTAWYALHHTARLKAGDRVLIHAAAGGVGLAAVHVARQAGADVFATAGSPAKRAYLRSLGVTHVFDSRSVSFADAARDASGAEGVDVVLNSLTGELIPAGLRLLRPGGRFVEIGKIDIWDADRVAAVQPGVSYTVLDLGAAARENPGDLARTFSTIRDAVERGTLPPLPRHVFELSQAREAFRFMAQARHTGKVVLRHPEATLAIDARATYLITGGLGGVGLVLAHWLAEQGARHLLLVGRSPAAGAAREAIARIEATGALVHVASADVADRPALERVLATIPTDRPLRGIIHAAGVLDDGLIEHQTPERMARVLAPKVEGVQHLHALTIGHPLDLFVLCSSSSAAFGAVGQAGYAAANAYLDAFAEARRIEGRPALSVGWGPWSEVGMAAAVGTRARDAWAAQGIRAIDPARGGPALAAALATGHATSLVVRADWQAFERHLAGRPVPALLSEVVRTHDASSLASRTANRQVRGADGIADRLLATAPSERRDVVREHVKEQVGLVLGLRMAAIADHQALMELGMDSLMGVELSNRLTSTIGRSLPATLVFECPTIDQLTDHLLGLLAPAPAPSAAAVLREGPDTVEAHLDALSDDEIERRLNAELDRAGY